MVDKTVSGGINPITGLLEWDYEPIDPAYQLGAGRFSPSRFDMELVYPRSNSETSQYSYHRIWQTGEPMNIPVRAMWGSFPHCYKILSAPAGWSIGEWLVPDVYGDLVVNDAYGTLSNASVSAGTHNIIVGIWDMTGSFKRAIFSIQVGNYGFYAAPSATGTGDGSSASNCMALINAHVAADGVSPAKNKILYIRGGDYTWTNNFIVSANKSLAIVGYRSEVPNLISATVGAGIKLNAPDIMVTGLKISGWGDSYVFATNGMYDRQSVWRCEIDAAFGRYTVDPPTDPANNEAGWFASSPNNSTKRQYLLYSEITYTNCHETCGFTWYSVKGLVERQIWNTNKATLGEPIWFPKASCECDMRLLRYDNVVATSIDGSQGVINPYNNEQYSRAKVHARFNFVRAHPSVGAAVWNGADNGEGNNYPAEGYDDHNTYIGGGVAGRNYGGDLITFTNDVVQNASGGVGVSSGTAVLNTLQGTSGVVDSDGRLINLTYRGIYGHQIYAG